ncbi:MAG: hypothetical protein ACRCYO_11120 [Bacteroidia bacterium]
MAKITIDNRIVNVDLIPNKEISLEVVKDAYARIAEILDKKVVVILMDMRRIELTHYPMDVMRYVSDNDFIQYQQAYAILIRGLAQKLIANFYLRVFKPKTPTRIFTDANEVRSWLQPHIERIEKK